MSKNDRIILAQRLREYVHSPHHAINPSEALINLVEEISQALRDAYSLSDDQLSKAYWDFDARVKGYPPYNVPYGQECAAFKASINFALEKATK